MRRMIRSLGCINHCDKAEYLKTGIFFDLHTQNSKNEFNCFSDAGYFLCRMNIIFSYSMSTDILCCSGVDCSIGRPRLGEVSSLQEKIALLKQIQNYS